MQPALPTSSGAPPSLVARFFALPLLARTALWTLAGWPIFLIIGSLGKGKHDGALWGSLLLSLFVGAIGYAIKSSAEQKAEARALWLHAEPTRHFQNHLARYSDFGVAQWVVLPTPAGALAIATNADASRFALLDFTSPRSSKESIAPIGTHWLEARDILRAELSEDSYGQTLVQTQTKTKGKSRANTGSLVGRAVVGGALLGPAGMVLGGATGSRSYSEVGTTTGTHTSGTRVRRLDLVLTVNNPLSPLVRLPFYAGDMDATSPQYGAIAQNAQHWRALLEVAAHRVK